MKRVPSLLETKGAQAEADVTVAQLGSECLAEATRLLQGLCTLKVDVDAKGRKRLNKITTREKLSKLKEVERSCIKLQKLNGLLSTRILRLSYLGRYQLLDIGSDTGHVDNIPNHSLLRQQQSCEAIIESLRFPELDKGLNIIADAHRGTYAWVLEHEHPFKPWLREGSGVFWVTGKAGSGKSTLMKYICAHDETKDVLATWAGARRSVVAKFFFWHAGANPHKSLSGLLRSILYRILVDDPALTKDIFPARYAGYETTAPEDYRPSD